jgi:hypothetical protein
MKMPMRRLLVLPLLLPLLSACGLVYGQLMRAGEGIKSFRTVSGEATGLPASGNLVVHGPFARGEGAYVVCSGADEEALAEELGRSGRYSAKVILEPTRGDAAAGRAALEAMDATALGRALGFPGPVDLVVFGTLLERGTSVAPGRGVIMDVAFRLEFRAPATGRTWVVEVAAREPAERVIPALAAELARRLPR